MFPYSMATAAFCLPRPACDGLVTYLNLAERECVPLLTDIERRGQGCLAIRPLAAGRLLDSSLTEGQALARVCQALRIPPAGYAAFALNWPLRHPAVSGVIVSVSSMEHARHAVEAVQDAVPDVPAFQEAYQSMESSMPRFPGRQSG